ncbi:MAG: NAD-dependent epimerase/dehydratase family protein [Planctomycetota bacterium]
MIFKHALVTGGAGFIGSCLARELLKKTLDVTVIDNLSTGRFENVPEKAGFFEGDICDATFVKNILTELKIDIIFHEAAKVSVRDSIAEFAKDAETNVMGTINILSACRDSSVKKIVYASSMAVYADSKRPQPIAEDYILEPISPYGISKLASEKYCLLMAKEIGLSCSVLRFFNTYGIGQQFSPYVGVITIFINRLLKSSTIHVFGDGQQRRDFIHVSDVVHANILAMEKDDGNNIYNVGTGKATSVNELAEMVRKKINPEAKIVHVDEHRGELKNSIADITKANTRLGFIPSKTFEDTIDEIIEWNRHKRLNARSM